MSGETPAAAGVAVAAAPAASSDAASQPARPLAWAPVDLASALPRDAPQQLAAVAEAAAERVRSASEKLEERSVGLATRAWNVVSGNGPAALEDVNERQEAALCRDDDFHLPGVEARPPRGGWLRRSVVGAAAPSPSPRRADVAARLENRRRRWWRSTRARQQARSG